MEKSGNMEHSPEIDSSYQTDPSDSATTKRSPGSDSQWDGRQVTATDEMSLWHSLPPELLVKIFDRLGKQAIPVLAQVCKWWLRVGLDPTRLRKLLAGDLEWSKELVEELKNKGCNSILLENVIPRRRKTPPQSIRALYLEGVPSSGETIMPPLEHLDLATQKSVLNLTETLQDLKNDPWWGLWAVNTFLSTVSKSFTPYTLASFPDTTAGPEASMMQEACRRHLIDAWKDKFQLHPQSTFTPLETESVISHISGFALIEAAQSTGMRYTLPGVWNCEFMDDTALSQRKLHLLIHDMKDGACLWKKLHVQTVDPVAFSTIKKFLMAVGEQQYLENFHFRFNRDYIQNREFWNFLSENLVKMPRLYYFGFQLTPGSRKNLTRECQWVTQMRNALRKMALNDPHPVFTVLDIMGADDTTALALFKAVTNTGVRGLHLSDGYITQRGVWELGRLLANDGTLISLSLENNGLTERTMRVLLRELKSNHTLEHVSLLGNEVITAPDLLKLIEELRDRGLELDVPAPPPQ